MKKIFGKIYIALLTVMININVLYRLIGYIVFFLCFCLYCSIRFVVASVRYCVKKGQSYLRLLCFYSVCPSARHTVSDTAFGLECNFCPRLSSIDSIFYLSSTLMHFRYKRITEQFFID